MGDLGKKNLMLAAPFGQQVDISEIVFVAKERLLATVSALGDVVRIAGGDDPCGSSHVRP